MELRTRTARFVVALAVFALGGCNTSGSTRSLPPLARATLPSVRDTFNAAIDRPRLIVFFSSACASCDTGSAALQAMLETLPTPVSVFAVWEPIAAVDAPPTSHMLGNLKAPHVHQLWDPAHVISDEMRAAELAHPSSPPQARTRTDSLPDGIMYDTMAVFAPGARWEATLPGADYLEVGLESKLDELRQQLERFAGKTGSE